MTHDTTVSTRQNALAIFQAGVAAADPYQAVKRHLVVTDRQLKILPTEQNLPQRTGNWSSIHLVAFGKAACAMTRAAQDIIPSAWLAGKAIAVTNYENVTAVENTNVIGAAHPLPNSAGLNAAQQLANKISAADAQDLVLVLVSGGGSALIPYPVETITLEEKIATTELLLSCGATINEINCVRKHLSVLKGGGLARLAAPAACHTLILSDVLGDDLSTIASGPTVPDTTTYRDAIAVFNSKHIWQDVPLAVKCHLMRGAQGMTADTPKPNDAIFDSTQHTLIGSNTLSVNAAVTTAQQQGYQTQIYSTQLCGEARDVADQWARHAKQLIDTGVRYPLALLAGGETTVTLTGSGKGGRNQEMALAFALAARQHGLNGYWTFLSAGTDGIDGPTDAAGGLVDQDSIKRMQAAGLNPVAALNNNDAYHALKSSQDLLITGATGTNVADLQMLLLHGMS